jgi:predicted nucleic-acid-binding protein
MVSVDTNVLVRLIAKDNATQSDTAETYIERHAWVSHLVLAETLWVLASAYGRTRSQLANIVEVLLSHEHLTLQEPEVVRSSLSLFRKRSSVSFSDCLILEIARKAGHLPLGTFDRDLAKLADTHEL